jgi:hypothetical protein
MISKFMKTALRMIVTCAGLLLFFSAPQVSAQYKSLDLTNTAWKVVEEDTSFVLTFTQGKTEQKTLVAILKGWGKDPLELRGEYTEGTPDAHVLLMGSYSGGKLIFNLKLSPGDDGQKPYLYGDISTGSDVFAISAQCEKQCPDRGPKRSEEADASLSASASKSARDFIGEWEDTSGEIGFKEYWLINFVNGEWQVTGKFIKGEEVVGRFSSDDEIFDATKGVLSFLQVFDPKPDESWLASNNIEATLQEDKLKIKVRGVEATLMRTPKAQKPVKVFPLADRD